MGKQLYILLLIIFWTFNSQASKCTKLFSVQSVTHKTIEKHIQYLSFEGHKIPYIDLQNRGPLKGTVFLVSGFSKNMNSWLPQAERLVAQGYRVISFDQSNVGRNLRENGIIHLAFGEGFSYDARLALEVIKRLRPKSLILAGHSRGARLAAEIGVSLKRLRKPAVQLDKLVLMSPYTNYNWQSSLPGAAGFYTDAWTDFTLNWNPAAIGRAMGANLKRNIHEEVEGLANSSKEAAYGYILKGTKPSTREGELGTLHFVKNLLGRKTKVKVVVSEVEEFFTPLEDVSILDIHGVDFEILEGAKYSHYWPEEHLDVFIKAVLDSK